MVKLMRLASRSFCVVRLMCVNVTLGVVAPSHGAEFAIRHKPALTIDLAQRIARNAMEDARLRKQRMSIAVVDEAGGLLYFLRWTIRPTQASK